ncbi:MAG: polyribonucleotide nucleotidyltransferase [Flavobacteriales bacterium]|nr:MAG: polyribonucleotide nucleotidyltransferase [Flavobacteriales bacterium]
MIPTPIVQEILLADGRSITLETGKLAKQADGAVVLRMGKCVLLATVVSAKTAQEGIDFLPLTVEYKEKYSAGGRMPGGFLKREGRPSDDEILTMRLVDRILRPMFPEDYHADTQIVIYLMSHDPEVAPDSLAALAASAALSVSDIPFHGPISEARVARINGELVINPTPAQIKEADIDLMVGGSIDSVGMVEGEMKEVSEKEMLDAIQFAHEEIKRHCEAQLRLQEAANKTEKREYSHETHDDELRKLVFEKTYQSVYDIAREAKPKQERSEAFKAAFETFMEENFSEEERLEKSALAKTYFHDVEYDAVRNLILDENKRLDGRTPQDIRPIWCEVDVLPSTHGSAVFTRGETQSITTTTLGTKLDENRIDNVTFVGSERFYLHYNFPPFSTGEARPMRGTSRREIGHGNLAQRALKPVIPANNPHVIRVVSEILESNGSSSMATVCAGTLSLMDAGVAIKKPVSGIAMGLITDTKSGKYAVLSDILGDEDHLGDMDFKVTGTSEGITACQMDIKIRGLSFEIMQKALDQAREGRLHILGEMLKTLAEPRPEAKPHAPKLINLTIPKDYIGAIIGPGGKTIQQLQADTGTTITIEEIDNRGHVEISGTDPDGMERAKNFINDIAFTPEVGKTYNGIVKSIQAYGAFVEIARGTDGLLHISEIAHRRLEKVEEELKEGDRIEVKLLSIDDRGKLKLSRKALMDKE